MKKLNKIIGIYKITSPSKRVYIGQSVDIHKRFRNYNTLHNCKGQFRLYNSFLKYGAINHKFEIIEICNLNRLNIQERYWQDYYDVLSKKGLNCRLTDTCDVKGKLGETTILKLIKNSSKAVICLNSLKTWDSAKVLALELGIKDYVLRRKLTGVTVNDTFYLYKNDIPMIGVNYNCKLKLGNVKKIINIETKVTYESIRECCLINGLEYNTIKRKLHGGRSNNTPYKYL